MLNTVAPTQVHHIARLAKAAREARDSLLHGAPDDVADGQIHPRASLAGWEDGMDLMSCPLTIRRGGRFTTRSPTWGPPAAQKSSP